MNKAVDVARRFFELLLHRPFDKATFSEAEVWMNMPALLEYAEQGRGLPNSCLGLLSEFSSALGLPTGAPVPAIVAAVERSYGLCPYGEASVVLLARYIRQQRNGTFDTVVKKKGPSLGGEF